jgi:hypothetical protein
MIVTKLPRRKFGSFFKFRNNTIAAFAIPMTILIFVYSNRELTMSLGKYNSMDVPSVGKRQPSMMEWRHSSQTECGELIKTVGKNVQAAAIDQKEALERSFVSKITLNPKPSTISASKADPYRRCRNAFIDLGTNIGDSIGYFVDNAIDVCSPMWIDAHPNTKIDAKFPRPFLDVATLDFTHRGFKPNPLFGLLRQTTKALPTATSESFCVYGMEGNPVFTERLTKLENFVSDMIPRPVQHLHIFTESVVTASDGPTKLYLDKVSVKQNVSDTKRRGMLNGFISIFVVRVNFFTSLVEVYQKLNCGWYIICVF